MIIIDKALARRQADGNPVRVALVGAGFMGKGIALQICKFVPGMELVAIANRDIEKARKAYYQADVLDPKKVSTLDELEYNIRNDIYS
ncbi:MAG: NAD(P)-dependent oxidoreductase, partial [Chitinophagaceae bacterium]